MILGMNTCSEFNKRFHGVSTRLERCPLEGSTTHRARDVDFARRSFQLCSKVERGKIENNPMNRSESPFSNLFIQVKVLSKDVLEGFHPWMMGLA